MSTHRLPSRIEKRGTLPLMVIVGLAALADLSLHFPVSPAHADSTARPAAVAQHPSPDDAYRLASRIDEVLARHWAAAKVEPAPPADDAEFLRRIFLDLAGKIPSVAESRAFLDDTAPDKRRKLVDQLLQRATYAAHFANTWRELMIPGASTLETRALIPQFEAWLRSRFANNTPYNVMAAQMLRATSNAPAGPVPAAAARPSPAAFFIANEQKPENLAAGTSRVFLGLQIQCAQCHHHPFSSWKREEFWGLAAFFGGRQSPPRPGAVAVLEEVFDQTGIEMPGTGKLVAPRYPDGSALQWKPGEGKRAALARWVTAPDNPYFARAAVNRLWSHFLGRGLVEPADNFDESNPPTHPEILDDLAREFVRHDFDLKLVIRALAATRAYQLSSAATHPSQDDPIHFARMPLRSLTPEQLWDSLVAATGLEVPPTDPRNVVVLDTSSPKAKFLSRFADSGSSRTDYQASILQALTLMNGQLIADATSLTAGVTLQAVVEAPFLDTRARIETLYLAALTRRPRPDELAEVERYVDRAGSETAKKQALADIFWALLNSAEFALNH